MFVRVFAKGDRSITRLVQGKNNTYVYKSCRKSNETGRTFLLNEAKFLRLLYCKKRIPVPKIKVIFHWGEMIHLRLEAIEGPSLEDMLLNRVRFPPSAFCEIITQMLDALQGLADEQVIHRDLHPGNILLAKGKTVNIIDFEMARKKDDGEDWGFCGVPDYWAPEIHTRASMILKEKYEQEGVPKYTYESDLFAAGIVVVELLFTCLEGKEKDVFHTFDEKASRSELLSGDAFYEEIQQKDFFIKMGCKQVTDAMATAIKMFFIKEQADRVPAADIKAALNSP